MAVGKGTGDSAPLQQAAHGRGDARSPRTGARRLGPGGYRVPQPLVAGAVLRARLAHRQGLAAVGAVVVEDAAVVGVEEVVLEQGHVRFGGEPEAAHADGEVVEIGPFARHQGAVFGNHLPRRLSGTGPGQHPGGRLLADAAGAAQALELLGALHHADEEDQVGAVPDIRLRQALADFRKSGGRQVAALDADAAVGDAAVGQRLRQGADRGGSRVESARELEEILLPLAEREIGRGRIVEAAPSGGADVPHPGIEGVGRQQRHQHEGRLPVPGKEGELLRQPRCRRRAGSCTP